MLQQSVLLTETDGFTIILCMEELHDRITFIRKGLELTQEEFAEAISTVLKTQGGQPVTRGAIGNWERPGRGIDLKNMRAITQLAEISLDWLATGTGQPPTESQLRRTGAKLLGAALPYRVSPGALPSGFVSVVGQAAGATLDMGVEIMFDQEPIGELPMLPGLVGLRDVYALEVTGTSMLPMFKPGDPIYVSPHTPIHRDDPMIALEHRSRNGQPVAFIKLMVLERRETVVTRQLNPPAEITFNRKPGLSTHRVLTFKEVMGYSGGMEPRSQAPEAARIRRGPKR